MTKYRDLDNKLKEVKRRVEELIIISNQELKGVNEESSNYLFLKDKNFEKMLNVLPEINNIEEMEKKYKDLDINFELLFENIEKAKQIKIKILPEQEKQKSEYSDLLDLYNENVDKIKESSENYSNICDEIEELCPDEELIKDLYFLKSKGFEIVEEKYSFFNTLFNKEKKENNILINKLKEKIPNLKSKLDFEKLYEKIEEKEKEKEKLNKNIIFMKSEKATTKDLITKKENKIEELQIIINEYQKITSISDLRDTIEKDIEFLIKNQNNDLLELMKDNNLIKTLNEFIENKMKKDITDKLKDNLEKNLENLEKFRKNINSTLDKSRYKSAMKKSSVLNKNLNSKAKRSYKELEDALEKLNKGVVPLLRGSNLILNNLQEEYAKTNNNKEDKKIYNDDGLINCSLFYSIVLLSNVSDSDYENLSVHFGSELTGLSNDNDLNIDIEKIEISDLNISNLDTGSIDVGSSITDF